MLPFFRKIRPTLTLPTVIAIYRYRIRQQSILRWVSLHSTHPTLADVDHIARCHPDRMRQPALYVCPYMNLHPKMSLTPFLALVHLRIPLPVPVLRRRARMDERCIHHRPTFQQAAPRLQRFIDGLQHPLAQFMLLKKVPEVQDRRLVRQGVHGQFKARKTAHRLNLKQRIFHPRVGERVPLLHEIRLQRHRLAASASRFRIVRLNDR